MTSIIINLISMFAILNMTIIIWNCVVLKEDEGSKCAEGSNVLLEPNSICKKSRRLGRGKLQEICRHDSSLLKEIINGINLGFRECEFQFKNRRWNCTTQRKSMRKILMKDTRETAFVNAITAAGVTFAVTRACTMGNLVECSCDKNHPRRSYNGNSGSKRNPMIPIEALLETQEGNNSKRNKSRSTAVAVAAIDSAAAAAAATSTAVMEGGGKNHRKKGNRNGRQKKFLKNLVLPEGEWEWGGCGDNVNFGFRKSKDFLDAKYKKRSDIRTLVKLHNNNAGRLAVRDFMRLECKCHGLSGSCTLKTCWLKMPSFREIGIRLKDRFDGAAKVIARNDGSNFMPEGPTIKPPSKHDLVYADESSDFCRINHKTGSLGTVGRECNATSPGVDGCDLLCCNRGYDHRIVKEKVNCKCVFKWCCEVSCSTCIERREVNTCR